jgi:hypothetical protein
MVIATALGKEKHIWKCDGAITAGTFTQRPQEQYQAIYANNESLWRHDDVMKIFRRKRTLRNILLFGASERYMCEGVIMASSSALALARLHAGGPTSQQTPMCCGIKHD